MKVCNRNSSPWGTGWVWGMPYKVIVYKLLTMSNTELPRTKEKQ